MSQAFVKESEEQWLHEISPTLKALVAHLTRENNGVRVYERRNYIDPKSGKEIFEIQPVILGGSHDLDIGQRRTRVPAPNESQS